MTNDIVNYSLQFAIRCFLRTDRSYIHQIGIHSTDRPQEQDLFYNLPDVAQSFALKGEDGSLGTHLQKPT